MANKETSSLVDIVLCGIWPYVGGQRLTCKGYSYLAKHGITVRLLAYAPDALELQKGNKTALIGMTRALQKKLNG